MGNGVLMCFENKIINMKRRVELKIKFEMENFIFLVLNDAHRNLKLKTKRIVLGKNFLN